jgi:membrane protease YdiL (CAAX protease family)
MEWPAIQFVGNSRKYPGILEWSILVGISVVVNMVLYAWSRIAKSTGTHKGVDRMVSTTKDRNHLTRREHLLYVSLALINATCEEICFRWFWWSEFAVYLSGRHGSNNKYSNHMCFNANVAQAIVFGSLHYYGIPSGLTGVCLTCVYGWIMGMLMEQVGDGGLFLPIIAHSIADYYLFSSVARGKAAGTKAKPKTSS